MKKIIFFLFFISVLGKLQAAPLVVTDFMDMEDGNDGQAVTTTQASNATYPLTGRNGVWANGQAGLPSTRELKVSTKKVRPPRGDIQIGSTLYPGHVPSTKSYIQKIANSSNHEYIDYLMNSPRPDKVSAGMFMYFSSEGEGWNANFDTGYDIFALTGNGGVNYLVFSLQTYSSPLSMNIHTNVSPCKSGVELNEGKLDKWYWVAFLYDYSGSNHLATMDIWNVSDGWVHEGNGTCQLPTFSSSGSESLWRISVGLTDNHGGATHNSYYYMDDLMINTTGLWPFVPNPGSTPTDTLAPAAPSNFKKVP